VTMSDRMLQRLRDEGLDVPEGSTLHRTYASSANRRNGAWSWFALAPDGSELGIGSQHAMKFLLELSKWEISQGINGDTWIDPPSR
jgi:hypothetical protein